MFKSKICIALFSTLLSICASLYAADNGNGTQSADHGTVPQLDICRWSTTQLHTWSDTTTQTAVTNVITTGSSVLGDIWIIPAFLNDQVKIYDATTGAGCSNAVLLSSWKYGYTVYGAVTNALPNIGVPTIIPAGSGRSATRGLVAITTLGTGSTNGNFFATVNWDSAVTR